MLMHVLVSHSLFFFFSFFLWFTVSYPHRFVYGTGEMEDDSGGRAKQKLCTLSGSKSFMAVLFPRDGGPSWIMTARYYLQPPRRH